MSAISNPKYPREILTQTGRQDNRNVIDHYKYWSQEAILADLDNKRHPFAVIAENFAHDFNISTLMRNANAFLARELWVVGRPTWDNRGSMGANHYQHVHRTRELSSALAALAGYQPIVIDNLPGAEPLEEFIWPDNPVMIFGQESIGVSPPALQAAEAVVYIPQYGSVRSLNVGVASGIAMHHFVTQWRVSRA